MPRRLHHARRPLQPMLPAVRRQGDEPIPPIEPGSSPVFALIKEALLIPAIVVIWLLAVAVLG